MMDVYVGAGTGRALEGLGACVSSKTSHKFDWRVSNGYYPCYCFLFCWGFSPDDAEADSIDFKLAPSKRLSHLQNVDRVILMIFQMRKYFKTTLNHILPLIIVESAVCVTLADMSLFRSICQLWSVVVAPQSSFPTLRVTHAHFCNNGAALCALRNDKVTFLHVSP